LNNLKILIIDDSKTIRESLKKLLSSYGIRSSFIFDTESPKEGLDMLNNAYAMAQFYDRDAPAEMASEGMKGFQEYMSNPDRRQTILERLEKVRQRVYK